MYTAIAGILLSLVLTLFNVRVSAAEIWECAQPNGSTLYTDQPQGQRSCEKFEPGSQLIYLPPRVSANVPSADAIYEEQEAQEIEAQSESRVEEQAAAPPDPAESYNAPRDSFWDWGEGRIFVYTYVSPLYSFPPSRHIRPGSFWSYPRTQHGIRHSIPLFRQPGSLTPKHFREKPGLTGAQPAQPQWNSPASSPRARGGSVGAAAAGAPPGRSPGTKPQIKR